MGTQPTSHLRSRNADGSTNGFARKSQEWDFDYVGASKDAVLSKFQVTEKGLSDREAALRLEEYGPNEPAAKKKRGLCRQLFSKFLNPLVFVLLVISSISIFFNELVNALIVGLMAAMSVILSFVQEYRAGRAAEKLSEMVRTTTTVWRGGRQKELNIREVVPGDIVDLFAGDMIPADIRIISCKDFFINQSSLTGESFPIEKMPTSSSSASASPAEQTNIAFMGSSVVSGTAIAVVVKTGSETQFGEMYQKLSTVSVTTAFDKGLRQFTMLMVKAMLCLVCCIFFIISVREADYLEAFLFSLGVAVGLTPEMLPMIVTFTLSQGAFQLAEKKAIVKRLNSIQNFGAMDVLCTDKTGTLTIDKIVLEKHCDINGREDEDVLRYAYINSFHQTGLRNLLDKAILRHERLLMKPYEKVDEVPFDFSRKIMSVVVTMDGCHTLIAKGAPREVYKRISQYELDGALHEIRPEIVEDLMKEYSVLSSEGFRVLAVAYKKIPNPKQVYSKEDEKDLILKGYVAFLDPPKVGVKAAIDALKKLGVDLKVLTGDNELVTKKICQDVGLSFHNVVHGDEVEKASVDELKRLVEEGNVFARLSPLQKERVIRALHENGHIVGYLGDGINDALALKTSDVGISVNNATDIAKESADIILLKKSLMILRDGVIAGRKTFGNIVKYIKMGASSNFGNMLSMTAASLFVPFLPMLPIQILLNNLLYDFSQIAIPTDHVDPEYVSCPRPWNVSYIKKFMLLIGPISSIFDMITFWVLLTVFHADPVLFHTGWFLESLCTQTLVIHVIRTRQIPFLESWPSPFLLASSLLIVALGCIIPLSSVGMFFEFTPPPAAYYGVLFLISSAYFLSVQMVKMWFVKRFGLV